MLHLKLPTDPTWADIAERNLEEILSDHAYCEQKAASTCISLIVKHNDKQELVETLTPIVSEEWGHFRSVLAEMKKRGYSLKGMRNDEYVVALLKNIRKGVGVQEQLLDKLLVCALIEARSCERFKILSQTIEDQDLRKFYADLMASEARHYTVFIKLARIYSPKERVDQRWEELLQTEKEILNELGVRKNRMH